MWILVNAKLGNTHRQAARSFTEVFLLKRLSECGFPSTYIKFNEKEYTMTRITYYACDCQLWTRL